MAFYLNRFGDAMADAAAAAGGPAVHPNADGSCPSGYRLWESPGRPDLNTCLPPRDPTVIDPLEEYRRSLQVQASSGPATPSPGELAALMQFCPACPPCAEPGASPYHPAEKASLVLPIAAAIAGYLLGKG